MYDTLCLIPRSNSTHIQYRQAPAPGPAAHRLASAAAPLFPSIHNCRPRGPVLVLWC